MKTNNIRDKAVEAFSHLREVREKQVSTIIIRTLRETEGLG